MAGWDGEAPDLEAGMEDAFEAPSTRLAVYGSLAPGESNAWVLEGLRGRWLDGTVRGRLYEEGWGSGMGYPGFRWSRAGDVVTVKVFESPDLRRHWRRIDDFEGPDYLRSLVPVARADQSVVVANIYQIRDSPGT